MKELWSKGTEKQRLELLNQFYGKYANYMAAYNWDQLSYGIKNRLENAYKECIKS